MPSFNQNPLTQRGISLITVLWLLVVLTLLALTFSQATRTHVMMSANFLHHAQAVAKAEEGVWRGVAMVLNQDKTFDKTVRLDSHVYFLQVDEGDLRVSLQSNSGLIDLNHAPDAVIASLMTSVSATASNTNALVQSLLDWRDVDDNKRPNGAEKADYLARGSAGFKNGPFNDTAELALINGMTVDIFEQLIPRVTVFSGQPRVDINTAPLGVLSSLPGITDSIANSLIQSRDDGQLNLSLIPAQTQVYIGAGNNEFITISSIAKVHGSIAGIVAVIQQAANNNLPVTIVSWRQEINPMLTKTIEQ